MGRSPDYLRSLKELGYVVLILGGILILLLLLIVGILLAILFAVIKQIVDRHHKHKEHKEERITEKHNRQIDAAIVADENRELHYREDELAKKYDREDDDIRRQRAKEDEDERRRRIDEDQRRRDVQPQGYPNPEEEAQIRKLREDLDKEKTVIVTGKQIGRAHV